MSHTFGTQFLQGALQLLCITQDGQWSDFRSSPLSLFSLTPKQNFTKQLFPAYFCLLSVDWVTVVEIYQSIHNYNPNILNNHTKGQCSSTQSVLCPQTTIIEIILHVTKIKIKTNDLNFTRSRLELGQLKLYILASCCILKKKKLTVSLK